MRRSAYYTDEDYAEITALSPEDPVLLHALAHGRASAYELLRRNNAGGRYDRLLRSLARPGVQAWKHDRRHRPWPLFRVQTGGGVPAQTPTLRLVAN